MTCRFELKIKKSKMFQCAAKYGPGGWAYVWKHNGWQDPCIRCPIKIMGSPLVINKELPSAEFVKVAGERIRTEDWLEIEKRGYEIGIKGLKESKS